MPSLRVKQDAIADAAADAGDSASGEDHSFQAVEHSKSQIELLGIVSLQK
jgi:hypothetical protein